MQSPGSLELITFDGGSGSLRVGAVESDQLIEAMISATAPFVSIGPPDDRLPPFLWTFHTFRCHTRVVSQQEMTAWPNRNWTCCKAPWT